METGLVRQDQARSLEESLAVGWNLLGLLPRGELGRRLNEVENRLEELEREKEGWLRRSAKPGRAG